MGELYTIISEGKFTQSESGRSIEKSNNLDYNILNKEVGTMEQTHPPRRTYYLNSRSILSRGQDDYFLFV